MIWKNLDKAQSEPDGRWLFSFGVSWPCIFHGSHAMQHNTIRHHTTTQHKQLTDDSVDRHPQSRVFAFFGTPARHVRTRDGGRDRTT